MTYGFIFQYLFSFYISLATRHRRLLLPRKGNKSFAKPMEEEEDISKEIGACRKPRKAWQLVAFLNKLTM